LRGPLSARQERLSTRLGTLEWRTPTHGADLARATLVPPRGGPDRGGEDAAMPSD